MENTIETIDYKGYKIGVWYDNISEYGDSDHLGKFYSNLRSWNPDKRDVDEAFEDGIFDRNSRVKEELIYIDVYAYIHSGIALSTSRRGQFADPFDSGLAGVMACTREDARKWLGDNYTVEDVEKLLESEVEEMDAFCQGHVYGFTIYDEDGNDFDSVCGFVGDMECCINDAKETIDNMLQDEYQEQFTESMEYSEAE